MASYLYYFVHKFTYSKSIKYVKDNNYLEKHFKIHLNIIAGDGFMNTNPNVFAPEENPLDTIVGNV